MFLEMLQIINTKSNTCSCDSESLVKDLHDIYDNIATNSMKYYRNNIFGLKQSITDKDIIQSIFRVTFLQKKINTTCKGLSLKINVCTPIDTEPCQY